MKIFLPVLILLLGLSSVEAQKADQPKKAAAAAKMAAKAGKPTLTSISPRGLQLGVEQVFSLAGKDLAEAAVLTSNAQLKPIIDAAASTATKVVFKLQAPAGLGRGSHDVWVKTPSGESAKLKLYADDLAPITTSAVDFKNGPVQIAKLPASVWGTLTETGQHDAYRFTAKAGEELVLDLAVAQVGSVAKSPTLEIVDANHTVLAVNRGLDSGSDPFLAWKAPADGDYHILVSNTTMDGSAGHVYRLTIGALPFVTSWSPLTAELGKETKVTLIGHHLGDKATVTMKADKEGMMNVPLDAKALRFRTMPSLRVSALAQVSEVEGNEDLAKAQIVPSRVAINGLLAKVGDTDHFAFDAKKGQTWMIETLAAQAGSPADTKLEILHLDGKTVARLLMQAVRDSYNNFRSVDANNSDIRLQNWEEMELNEYVWFNGDVMKIFRMPRGPDAGCFF
ncbi:MAG: PPC domain-containing protein, partial [Prosthecobacter sp.]